MRKQLKQLAIVILVMIGATAVAPAVDASTYCNRGGTCFFIYKRFSSSMYRNTSGVQSYLGDNYFGNGAVVDNDISAVADSTSSSRFSGINLYNGQNCSNILYWVPRGGSATASDFWNNKTSSFRLSRSGVSGSC